MKYIKKFESFGTDDFIEDIEEFATRIELIGYEFNIDQKETWRQFELDIAIINDDLGEEKQSELIDVIGHILRYVTMNGLLYSLKTYYLPKHGLQLRAICADETEIFKEIIDIYGKNKEVTIITIELFLPKSRPYYQKEN
jgi:hypothetical protein